MQVKMKFILIILSVFSINAFSVNSSDWMTEIGSSIQNKTLSELVWPGTHDSGSYSINAKSPIYNVPDWERKLIPKNIGQVVANWSKTQDQTFAQQLNTGIRYFDIRSCYNSGTKTIDFCHAMMGGPVQQGLNDIAAFAKAHPDEIILLDFNQLKMSSDQALEYSKQIEKTLSTYLLSSQEVSGYPNPTVKNVLKTKHNVIAFFANDTVAGEDHLFWPESLISSQWANASDTKTLYGELDQQIKNNQSHKAGHIFFYLGVHLTDDANTITKGLFITHAEKTIYGMNADASHLMTNAWLLDWSKKYPDHALNIIGVDAADKSDVVQFAINQDSEGVYPMPHYVYLWGCTPADYPTFNSSHMGEVIIQSANGPTVNKVSGHPSDIPESILIPEGAISYTFKFSSPGASWHACTSGVCSFSANKTPDFYVSHCHDIDEAFPHIGKADLYQSDDKGTQGDFLGHSGWG